MRVTMQCCDLCEAPLEGKDERKDRPKTTAFARKEGFLLTAGYSRGGWGQRRNTIDFSGEICGACFDTLQDLLAPAVQFISKHRERQKAEHAKIGKR